MSTKNTDPDTLKRIAEALGLHPDELEIVIEHQEEHDAAEDTDDSTGTPSYEDRPERYRSLTPREYANLTRNNSNGVEQFIEARRNPKPPAHRDNAQVRELIELRNAERKEERRKALEPMPKPYDGDDRPAWSNLAPGYVAQQADFRRQHDEHVAKVKAEHQAQLDELATRRQVDAEVSQDVAAEIEALRKSRREAEKDAAKKKKPKHGHV